LKGFKARRDRRGQAFPVRCHPSAQQVSAGLVDASPAGHMVIRALEMAIWQRQRS